MNDSFLRWCF